MTGGTLFRYFLRRYLTAVAQVVGIIIVIAFLVDFTEFARRAASWPDYTFGKGLYLSAMRMPMIAMLIWPFVALIAAMLTLVTLNSRYELVVVRSAGVSAWQFLAPICFGAGLVGLIAVTLVNPLAARSLAAVQELEMAFRGWTVDTSDELALPWLVESTPQGTTIIGAARTARRGLLLGDAVFLLIDREGTLTDRYDARAATLERGRWQLEDVRHTDAMKQTRRIVSAEIGTSINAELIQQRLTEPNIIPIYELPAVIKAARVLGMSAGRFATHFHSLLALPALMIAMTLIAATASLRFARMGQSATVLMGGLLSGFLLYVALITFTAFGNVGFLPPVLAAWTPVAVAFFFGVTFLLHREDG